ncbi:hypothetical protein Bbelb_026280 [Branchiostoma belcheri]|nr:hypothetical protein Bbelb_026280 [Branchiostoma belcheri]
MKTLTYRAISAEECTSTTAKSRAGVLSAGGGMIRGFYDPDGFTSPQVLKGACGTSSCHVTWRQGFAAAMGRVVVVAPALCTKLAWVASQSLTSYCRTTHFVRKPRPLYEVSLGGVTIPYVITSFNFVLRTVAPALGLYEIWLGEAFIMLQAAREVNSHLFQSKCVPRGPTGQKRRCGEKIDLWLYRPTGTGCNEACTRLPPLAAHLREFRIRRQKTTYLFLEF